MNNSSNRNNELMFVLVMGVLSMVWFAVGWYFCSMMYIILMFTVLKAIRH